MQGFINRLFYSKTVAALWWTLTKGIIMQSDEDESFKMLNLQVLA